MENTINGLADINGNYDHIDLGRLLAYAVEWGFPPRVLALSLPTKLGPKGVGAGRLDVEGALLTKEVGVDW